MENLHYNYASENQPFYVLPLRDMVFFPQMVAPLIVGRETSIASVDASAERDKILFLVAQKDAGLDEVRARDLYRVGVLARVLQVVKLPNNLLKVLVEGVNRATVRRYHNDGGLMRARLEPLTEHPLNEEEAEARKRQLKAAFKDYCKQNDEIPEEVLFTAKQIKNIYWLVNYIASYLEIEIHAKQKILETGDAQKQIKRLINTLHKENRVLSLKSELDIKVQDQMVRSQRNYFLQEQLRVIRKELGEDNPENTDITFLKQKIEQAQLPEQVNRKADEELERLKMIPPLSPEYNVIRTYLEWLASLPWRKHSTDQLDIDKARRILDEDHYGLKKPKERILEYIAVLQRVKKMHGPILCLAGPPGVGKTSLGKSIARALDREFTRISLGGVRDEAEIRGHRRTYIGSMPGKIIQGLKKTGTVNPVFLLDEVDKLGNDYRGDPSSALLEVLDPEQNHTFIDHYLEVEYDLSNVLFIITANNAQNIPEPLLDRAEIINLPGYMDFEKMQIAIRHLFKKQKALHGLEENELLVGEEALNTIIRHYTREAGVRNLEREISTLCRKSVVRLNRAPKMKAVKIEEKNLSDFLGQPKYDTQRLQSRKEIGVANGLAWTPYGGNLLRVEVTLMPGKQKLTLTGKLGEVMQESAKIAIAYIRSRQKTFHLNGNQLDDNEVHIHLPEGAIPKDGPSAGITLTSALISALSEKSFPDDVAMTGEITLRGKILAVGGLNEKLLAAKRYGFKTIILPEENRKDVKEINEELYRDLKLKYVDNYDEVYRFVFAQKKSAGQRISS